MSKPPKSFEDQVRGYAKLVKGRGSAIIREHTKELVAQTVAKHSSAYIPADWQPTVANINALPDPLRRYIHDLETRADPSFEVQTNYELRQMLSAAEAMAKRYIEELEAWSRAVGGI